MIPMISQPEGAPVGAPPITVAVIEDDEATRTLMVNTATAEGFATITAADGLSGLQLIRDEEPDIVLLDILMPGMSGLDLLRRLREDQLDPIVIVNTAYGTEDHAIEALRLRANDYLKKPIRHGDLVGILRKYGEVVGARRAPSLLPDFVESKHCVAEIDNDLRKIATVAEYLTAEGEMRRSRDIALGCTLGLVELITNAVEHGNLGITGIEKLRCLAGPGDSFGKLVRERSSEPHRASRRVRIRLVSTREYSEWLITDEGDGFDWELYVGGMDQFGAMDLHGRGIFLACSQFDEVEYNAKGNEVRARKYKQRAPAP